LEDGLCTSGCLTWSLMAQKIWWTTSREVDVDIIGYVTLNSVSHHCLTSSLCMLEESARQWEEINLVCQKKEP
jgi:hypothetical protein